MSIAIAILTILGPALVPVLVWWLEKKLKAPTAQEQVEAELEQVDAHIKQHLGHNPGGLLNLSLTLERLSREAERKRGGHP